MLEGETTVEDYLRIHRRANGDFQEILRIIEEEGLQEKLEYWVEVTRRSIGTIADHNRAGKAASEPIAKVGATVGKKSSLNDPNEPKYCLCNKGSVGIMIRCDNVDSCKYKWFHLECVGLTVAPSSKDKWYCTDCRGDVNIGKKANIDPQALPPDSGNPEFVMDTEVYTFALYEMPGDIPSSTIC
ncbi:hypothetical protein N5P37_009946 [Trichoderma harzianum]|uniref:PHD-type domain-containing protein n=1 Tax=Trichoderma harzianum CBS 226.95 TaxID=983964 RepID=A0A2T4A5M6_TRIHA|nr:hypothetical protein M431DRAFT_91197 [Trichoderma harzianum CBS 226.95]KAK0757230.1 hypothetical protein N5P37_009946 [Trichoderma harzianum]PTB52369.1 hypothetical protein M431DRAFT_91197 [Trichoderma harzianum CBS 226.95]